MTVDPIDDCTFWYTQEYLLTNGAYNWNTRIANFKFPGCDSGSYIGFYPDHAGLRRTNRRHQPARRSRSPSATTNRVALTISSIVVTGDFSAEQ